MREDIVEWLALANSPGLGSVGIRRLVDRFGSAGSVLSASISDLREVEQIGLEVAREIRRSDCAWAHAQLASCATHNVDILTLADSAYPSLLLETFSPPPLLYLKDDFKVLQRPTVALVGARNSSPYGRHVAGTFAEEIAGKGVCVVSGMALGIDACAHVGALRTGATAAVLGTGLDHPYPVTNLALFHQICEKGVVLSEFPMGTTAHPKHFPRRNQTISGLSQGVVVVEGGPRSGSLLTAQYALEQNREVFAVPGPVTSAKSLGPHHLIRQGAHLAQSPDDILAHVSGVAAPADPAASTTTSTFSDLEGKVIACLASGQLTHIDTIANEVHLPPHEVLAVLLTLELSSHICQLPGKQFTLNH